MPATATRGKSSRPKPVATAPDKYAAVVLSAEVPLVRIIYHGGTTLAAAVSFVEDFNRCEEKLDRGSVAMLAPLHLIAGWQLRTRREEGGVR